jgi:hypothetical protein
MESAPWQGGEVRVYDYCMHPGSYDCQVEWFGSKQFFLLAKAGDYQPHLRFVRDALQIVYRVRHVNDESTWRTLVYESPTKLSREFESVTSGSPPPHAWMTAEEKK